MGLFSNSKKPCPICGNATPRLFPDGVAGIPICRECESKIDLPDGVQEKMTLDDFRQYLSFYQENQILRDSFDATFSFSYSDWGSDFQMDVPKKLFRINTKKESLVMESSCLKAFRILEDGKVLFESSPKGLNIYESDTPSRVQALAPLVSQFRVQMQQYEYMEKMEKKMKEMGEDKKGSTSFTYISRPEFEEQPISNDFVIEMTLEHPYWSGVHSRNRRAPKFDQSYPSVQDFLRSYQKEMDAFYAMAANLMILINPDAPEVHIPLSVSPDAAAVRTVPTADPIEEIQKYKALLDSGIITEEEFTAKKRQLLGI